jgi:myo-inositol-1(or 4)-monophosphatase
MMAPTDLDIAIHAAQSAAALAAHHSPLGVRIKSEPGDLVTDADLAAERLVRDLVAEHRPRDGFLGEEGSASPGERRWVADAIDGTLNFVRGDPFWCSAVALEDEQGPLVAGVHHVASGETFSAQRGLGCWLNGQSLTLASDVLLPHAVLSTYLHPGDAATPTAQRALASVASARVRGSGTLELAWLAAGRVDVWLQRDVSPWDWIPGALLVVEAGGVCETVQTGTGAWSYASVASSADDLRSLLTAP